MYIAAGNLGGGWPSRSHLHRSMLDMYFSGSNGGIAVVGQLSSGLPDKLHLGGTRGTRDVVVLTHQRGNKLKLAPLASGDGSGGDGKEQEEDGSAIERIALHFFWMYMTTLKNNRQMRDALTIVKAQLKWEKEEREKQRAHEKQRHKEECERLIDLFRSEQARHEETRKKWVTEKMKWEMKELQNNLRVLILTQNVHVRGAFESICGMVTFSWMSNGQLKAGMWMGNQEIISAIVRDSGFLKLFKCVVNLVSKESTPFTTRFRVLNMAFQI